jgi:hypothetical protein
MYTGNALPETFTSTMVASSSLLFHRGKKSTGFSVDPTIASLQSLEQEYCPAHTVAQNGVVPLRTLTVGPTFTSLEVSLSLQGTGITKLVFPAESPITTTGAFVLAIDSTLAKTVVLPRWVVQQGPWSLV